MWLHPSATIYFYYPFPETMVPAHHRPKSLKLRALSRASPTVRKQKPPFRAVLPSLGKSLNGFNPLLPHCKTEVTTLPSLEVSLLRTLFLELNVMTHWNPSRVCGSNVSAVASVGVKVCAVSTGDIKVVPTPIFARVGTHSRRRIWVCPQLQLLLP